ncbi:hypothetical protein L615_001800000210 [Nocardioides sp. J9]|uniref:hypothetical protein n=1 Tax=unclassified Nocardioides TaxID=2615069 RepID=UPI00048E1636|nr:MULTISPECIES: hypothetical protein [unclassified Nocardioides]TWH01477.1 hypothetical protein L615_001800000210 [Nocardioides sp. J9]
MSNFSSRVAAVAVGSAILVTLGATGATAAKLITSAQIQNGTIRSIDVKDGSLVGGDVRDGSITGADLRNGSVTSADIKDGAVRLADLSQAAKDALTGAAPAVPEGVTGVEVATLDAPVVVDKIGGPINANNTDLDLGFELPAGTYLVTVDGAFLSDVAAQDPDVDVYPQLSLWLDKSGDGAFQWQNGEGSISPNALMPTAADRHISVSGSTVITLDAPTRVGLLAFGYDGQQGTARSGEIKVSEATLTATPLG